MTHFKEGIDICNNTRNLAAKYVEEVLKDSTTISEAEFRDKIKNKFAENKNIYERGWYEPPPFGIAALFSEINNFGRLRFDTLRKQEFWSSTKYRMEKGSVGIVYLSPVNRGTATIGDFGLTIYQGDNVSIKQHFKNSLDVIEQIADYTQVGMEFREIHNQARKLFKEIGVNNDRTVTYTDKVGTNLGHTIPWTWENPSELEINVINSRDFNKIKDLISHKRINVNREEKFKVPENVAFTIEARLEDTNNLSLPLVFFHVIVQFIDGNKRVNSNFNSVFKLLKMGSFVKSKY
ncbi:MAG: hypothetical protein A2172_05210 [Candidatus Woykebacteria bacterium RBG_13_40_15]|uniref:Peptidase M24 domain-containing protein n=1 Tax=Candidatus Woykebacteria bacterium RBG_13_40_15 TaxID=1802593 RepID=A0A1G1W5Z3_9BACT|nr:MAG: hypothetical protein A2172_05210 [Candidatus Woykebacteria bacterium RBG_13_40_15]